MRFTRVVIILAALGAAAGTAWVLTRPPTVLTATAHGGSAAEVIYATGVAEPLVWAKVTPLARSRIAWHCRCEGQKVEAGHVLARLDESAPRAELAQVQARADFLASELSRQTDLVARGTTSRVSFERTQSELTQALGQVAALNARLTDYVMTAPLAGTVLRADGYVGEIAAGETLFWVGQLSPLRIVAEVNEEDVPRIIKGMKVLLRNDGFPATPLSALVGDITPKGDPASKTFRVYLDLPTETPLRIGMSVEANIVVREKGDALLVPAEAIVDGKVQRVVDGRIQRVAVEAGIRGTRMVEIVSGLSTGDVVMSPARAALTDGARVQATPITGKGG